MAEKNLKKMYRTVMDDHFPSRMEVHFVEGDQRQVLVYEKVTWVVDGVRKGLRYGENPGQQAALYRLINGNLVLGEVETIQPGRHLVGDAELLQSGKHPGKINLTDVDNALSILRHLTDKPCVAIMKHNNPSGVALGETLADAFHKAHMADRIAAFGGAVVCNRPLDRATAELIAENYVEVVAAQDFEEGVLDILSARRNLRVMRLPNMARLSEYALDRVVDFKSLMDGGVVVQTSFVPSAHRPEDFMPAQATKKGREYRIERLPTEQEYADMLFGWMVESGVSSNSVIYVKDGVTVGIGTGEQDRVGVAAIARDKAYVKTADRICWERHHLPFNQLEDPDEKASIEAEVNQMKGGLDGSVMISDGFFPFRDGVDVGLRQGVTAVLQPGGSLNDHESIQACNEAGATMMFTGQRSFKH